MLAKLVEFIGYGPSRPEVVFLGIEEAGGGDENIATRATSFRAIEDLFQAHELLKHEAQCPSPYDSQGNPVEQWNTASVFALALADADTSLWPSFWRNHLGRTNFETFLMECYPVPRKGMAHRMPGYDPKRLWREQRSQILKDFISTSRPRFIVAYGNPTHECLSDLVSVASWMSVGGTAWSVGVSSEGTVVCRVGFFGNGKFNRNDVPMIAKMMRHLAGAPLQLTLP